jgi:hypothetical protein
MTGIITITNFFNIVSRSGEMQAFPTFIKNKKQKFSFLISGSSFVAKYHFFEGKKLGCFALFIKYNINLLSCCSV